MGRSSHNNRKPYGNGDKRKTETVPTIHYIPKGRIYRASVLKCPSCGGPTIKYQELCEDCVRKRDKQIAQLLFTCKKCKGSQISIQKMKTNEFSQIITSAKCPKCEKSTQIVLDSLKIGDWIDPLKQSFFKCGICGSYCRVVKTEMKKNTMKVYFYCDRDWIEIQKEIPVALFPVLMTQVQKM
jgi:ssDNA-binding Zn-finger/Zn-ribbon topoisomerase 1